MIFKKMDKTLKNGTVCFLRSAMPEDAAEVLEEYKRIVSETEFSLSAPDEVVFTEQNERDFLESYVKNEGYLFVVAEIDGKIIGNVCFSPVGPQRRVSHRCTVSVAVLKKFWGIGIGTALMNAAVKSAQNFGFRQMELSVAATNTSAIALYTKLGFEACGSIPNSFKYNDGTFDDEILMIKKL